MRKLFIFWCFVPSCSTQMWRLAIDCVKFCNNIKRRYGRVNHNLFSTSALSSFVCCARWMAAAASFPAQGQTRPCLWQAFDVAPWWAVPLRWPLNRANTPVTVHIKAPALCLSEYLIAHHFTQDALLLWERCWPTGPNLSEKSSVIKTQMLSTQVFEQFLLERHRNRIKWMSHKMY